MTLSESKFRKFSGEDFVFAGRGPRLITLRFWSAGLSHDQAGDGAVFAFGDLDDVKAVSQVFEADGRFAG